MSAIKEPVCTEELRSAFRIFDKDNDGFISKKELGVVLGRLGQYPTSSELDEMLSEVDMNGDGKFSFEEFVYCMTSNSSTFLSQENNNEDCDEEEELRQAFKIFDRSGIGYITSQDIYQVMRSLEEEITDEEIDDMIDEVDVNGDGRIDFEEFINCLKKGNQGEKTE